jgi:hypothetical protein
MDMSGKETTESFVERVVTSDVALRLDYSLACELRVFDIEPAANPAPAPPESRPR